jgi:hypothetical protein
VTLYLHSARQRGRAPSAQPPEPVGGFYGKQAGPEDAGFPYGQGQVPPHVLPMPMYYPQYAQPNYQLPYHPAAPGAPAPLNALAAPTAAAPTAAVPTAAAPDDMLYPDIVSWC